MTQRTGFKVVLGAIASIALGAIGSGVWERVLSTTFDRTFRTIIGLTEQFTKQYSDSIYLRAAHGPHEDWAFRSFALLALYFGLACAVGALLIVSRDFRRLLVDHPISTKLRPYFAWCFTVVMLGCALAVIIGVSRGEAVFRTTSYSIQSMEIIRPKVGEAEYLALRSRYLQIRNRGEFMEFNEILRAAAKQNHLRLPDFEPY